MLVQKRTYERQLNAVASIISSHMPLLVHQESGWLTTIYALGLDVMSRIRNGEINNKSALNSIYYVLPRYQLLLDAIKDVQASIEPPREAIAKMMA